jgi:ABC-type uncharacterized transport system involved in gliding motility auxiliary subunit
MLQRIGSFIGWVGTALVFGAVAVVWGPSFGISAIPAEWGPNARYAAWAGLACVFIYMATQWKDIAQSLSRRQTRLSSIALSTVVVVLALLIGVNYLASRRNKRWDLTANQQFSLSDQTRQILQKLDAPVKVIVFDRPVEFDKFRDRLNEYAYVSKQVSVDYVDVDKQPVLANQNQVQSYGTVVFNYKGRTERVVSADEQQLTNGLIKLITGAERTVYFLQGHGEKDIASSERSGYSEIASGLQSDNFKTAPLVLAQAGAVPADATVVVVAGPSTDLLAPEVDLLKKYLDGGGKLLVMADPPRKADEAPFTNLAALLHDWAIDLGNNVVVDVSGVGQLLGTDASVPVAAPPYPSHAIGQGFNLLTAYPLTRSVTPVSGGVNGRTAQTFIQTSANSWGETNLAEMFATRKVENDKAADLQGPISIAAAVSAPVAGAAPAKPPTPGEAAKDEAPKPETRMAVIGDADFASNSLLGIQGNRDMFLNTLNWLSQQENLISIRPKDPQDRRLTMTASQQVAVRWLALLVVPAVIWGAGIYNWSRRRG